MPPALKHARAASSTGAATHRNKRWQSKTGLQHGGGTQGMPPLKKAPSTRRPRRPPATPDNTQPQPTTTRRSHHPTEQPALTHTTHPTTRHHTTQHATHPNQHQ